MVREKLTNYLNQVWQRFNLEGMTLTGALGVLSLALVPVHSTLTVLIHESSEHISDEHMWVIAVAVLGVVNLIGIPLEAKTLEKTHYSSSASATATYDATGNPWLGSVVNHLQHYPRAVALNPIVYAKIWEMLIGQGMTWHGLQELIGREGGRLTAESAITVTATLGLWSIAFNYLILTERAEPVVDRIRQIWTKVFHVFRGRQDQMTEIDLIQ